ncbi:MAG: ATP-binding protein [Promethearchaeia archaeon]
MTEVDQKRKIKRKMIKIDKELCTGCGKCVTGCAEGALAIIDGKAEVVNEAFCDGLGACIGECPEGALEIVERETYPFDEEKVEEYLDSKKQKEKKFAQSTRSSQTDEFHCSCPSSQPLSFNEPWKEGKNDEDEIPSALRQWPTKLALVNPEADYFQNNELLIVSDCAPVAFSDFHRKILRGKPLITTCPMLTLDEAQLDKLETILKINSIETVHLILMDVPCCQKIKIFLEPIVDNLQKDMEVIVTILGREGKINKQTSL